MRAARPSHLLLFALVAPITDLGAEARVATATAEQIATGRQVILQFGNGDRLTGELLSRSDGKIHFRSPILGDLILPETDAAVLDASSNADTNNARALAEAATATPQPAPGVAASTAASTPAKPRWKGKVELGTIQQTGRTETLSYNLRAEAERSTGRHTVRGTGRILYATQNDTPSADRQEASLRWRYQLSPRTFAQSQSTYYRDHIVQIQTNVEQNVGVGYRVIDRPRHTANLGGGITAQYREWNAGTNGWAPYAEVFQDYTFKISNRITFNQDAVVQYSPADRATNTPDNTSAGSDEQNYKVRFNSTLQGKITERISVNLRFEYELDNAIQLEDSRVTQRVTSSIGYAF